MSSDTREALSTVFTGGTIVFLGLFVELSVSFLAKILIARVLGPVNYGVVALGVTTMIMVTTIVLLGLNRGVARTLPRYDDAEHRRGVLLSAFGIAVPLSIIAGIIVSAIAPQIATELFGIPSASPIIRVFGLIVPIAVVMRLAVGSTQGLKRALPKVYIQNLALPVGRFVAVIAALLFGFGAIGIAWAYAFSYAMAAAVGMALLIRYTPLAAREITPVPMRRELLVFSVPLAISMTMTLVFSDIDTFMLGYFKSASHVGVYNTVYPLAELLVLVMSSFGFIFMPVVSELHEEGDIASVRRLYQIATKWVFIVTFPLFAVVVLFPVQTIQLTFGSEYVVGDLALIVLAVAFFTHAIAGPNMDALTSIGRTRAIMYDNVFVALLNVGLNLALIPEYSILGAAWATAISYVVLNLLYSTQLYMETGIQPFTRALVRSSASGVLGILLIYGVVTTLFEVTLVSFVLTVGAMFIVYGLSVVRFGVEREEIMLVLRFEDRFGVDLGVLKAIVRRMMS